MQILVSIIIPVHQIHVFFKSCVESALAQTYKNIEVIIACNGYLDIEECKRFLNSNDTRIVYLKTNAGRHNARNEAMVIANGELIQFLDYDDLLFPEKIQIQINSFSDNYNKEVSISQWKKFNKDLIEDYFFPYKILFEESKISTSALIKKLAESEGFIATASWLVPKKVLKELFWIDSPNDDAVFFSEICRRNPDFIMIHEILAGYRIHNSNTSSIRSKTEFNKLMNSWKIIHHNLKNLEEARVSIYLYHAYLNLIQYSKQINKYRLFEVVYNCLYYGIKEKKLIVIFKDLKNSLFK